jgi:hypothetical protein
VVLSFASPRFRNIMLEKEAKFKEQHALEVVNHKKAMIDVINQWFLEADNAPLEPYPYLDANGQVIRNAQDNEYLKAANLPGGAVVRQRSKTLEARRPVKGYDL